MAMTSMAAVATHVAAMAVADAGGRCWRRRRTAHGWRVRQRWGGLGEGGSEGRQRWTADADGIAEGKAEKRGGWRWRRRREWRRWWRRREREAAAAATAARAAVPEASASLLRALSARPAPYVYVHVHEPRVHGV